ncbi:MAG: SGNH/GDSL hydrolase family protein [Proteobacteria bacterium]|nr:SGNH/GDSL hydrolase family protein [Pseudomonadota bacterium]
MLSDLCNLLLGFFSILLAANAGLWLAFRQFPALVASENQRLQFEYLARFTGPLRPYIPDWFDIPAAGWDAYCAEYRKLETGSHIYEPFVEFRHPGCSGKYVNFDPAGFRHGRDQGPWPPSPDFYNVFFFGGSTALNVGPDWTCISSYLQDNLNRRNFAAKPVRAYNFGRGSYLSTQERILFQQLLIDGHTPDMVVFLDGVNDFYLFDGRPVTWGIFTEALDVHNREQYEAILHRRSVRPKWQKLSQFLESLPLSRALYLIGDFARRRSATAETVLYKSAPMTPIADELLYRAARRYLENKRQIEVIARDRGIAAVFVWQPTPAYKYDLKHHIAMHHHYGLGGHERSGLGYAVMAQILAREGMPKNLIWLADMQEKAEEALYLDSMHYTAAMSGRIADLIATRLAAEFPPARPAR